MFTSIIEPITSAIAELLPAALLLVTTIGVIWCIVLGVKLAKAEEAQDRDKAKAAIRNAIIGFVLIFVLIAVLWIAEPYLYEWLEEWLTESDLGWTTTN